MRTTPQGGGGEVLQTQTVLGLLVLIDRDYAILSAPRLDFVLYNFDKAKRPKYTKC